MDRLGTCCAQLDYFDWSVPPYDPDMLLSERVVAEEVRDNHDNSYTRPDVLPARRNEATHRPKSPPIGNTRSQMKPFPDEPDVISVGQKV